MSEVKLNGTGTNESAWGWLIGLVPMIVVFGALLVGGRIAAGPDEQKEAAAALIPVLPAGAAAASISAPSVVLPLAKPARVRLRAAKVVHPVQTVVVSTIRPVPHQSLNYARPGNVEVIICDLPGKFPERQIPCKPESPGESGIALAWTRNLRQQDEDEDDCVPLRSEASVAQHGEASVELTAGP